MSRERDASYNYVVTSPTSATLLPDGSLPFPATSRPMSSSTLFRIPGACSRISPSPSACATPSSKHRMRPRGRRSLPRSIPTSGTCSAAQPRPRDKSSKPISPSHQLASSMANRDSGLNRNCNIAPRLSVVYAPNTKDLDPFGLRSLLRSLRRGPHASLQQSRLLRPFLAIPESGKHGQLRDCAAISRVRTICCSCNLPVPSADPTQAYPYTVPDGSFGINWGIDNHVKTPYVEAFNLSVQRELPGGFLLDTAYVGRLGRHLFQQLDLAEPVNLNDPQGAGDYFTAGTTMSKFYGPVGWFLLVLRRWELSAHPNHSVLRRRFPADEGFRLRWRIGHRCCL
jgi:hypothetical protein